MLVEDCANVLNNKASYRTRVPTLKKALST